MKVNREKLLKALRFAKLGTSNRGETLEQSNAFVFVGEDLFTFNDEILTRSKSPLDFTAAILADEFLKLVDKFPDDEVDVVLKGEEVVLKGARRSAGVTSYKNIELPYDAVPKPRKWKTLGDGVVDMLKQAARTCGKDFTQELTTAVHVTPSIVEACDNHRLFRYTGKTGFTKEALIPSTSMLEAASVPLKKVSVGDGWVHFRSGAGQTVSVRCTHEKYHDELDALLKMKDGKTLTLPKNLADILSRTTIMSEARAEPQVRVRLKNGELALESRNDTGWYKERKKIKYKGKEMAFDVNPNFLVDLLRRAKKVLVSPSHRMRIEADGIQFVVSLNQIED